MGFNSAFKGLKRKNRTVFIILFRRNGVVLFITWQGREILLPLSLNIKKLINVLNKVQRTFCSGHFTYFQACHLARGGCCVRNFVFCVIRRRHDAFRLFISSEVHPDVRELLTLRRRIKSHLLFAGIIRSSPFSLRQQDKG